MKTFNITTTKSGKCDITLEMYNKNDAIVAKKSSTYDIKPTVKELLNFAKCYKKHGAETVKITTTPSYCSKLYKL